MGGAAVLCCALLLAGAAAQDGAPDPAPDPAMDLLAEAEAAAARGNYKKARDAYRKLAKEFPDTEAGRTGERRSGKNAFLGWTWLGPHGPPDNRVDVVVMGDGYRFDQQDEFDSVARIVPENFGRQKVLEEYFAYHNFLRANVTSADDGIDEYGREADTALDASRSQMIQGQVQVDAGLVRSMLQEMSETDGLAIVFVKNGNLGTGGFGVATVGGRAPKTMVHEWGHAFADLMDEYSANTGHRGLPTSGPNVATTKDPKQVPWAHWIEAKAGSVGVYPGGDGRATGAWKPTGNCIMDVGVDFCPVCREAIVLRIHEFVDPIEETAPRGHAAQDEAIVLDAKTPLREQVPVEFEVRTLRPKSHSLVARWWVLDDGPRAQAPERFSGPERLRDRRTRGPLPAIADAPAKQGKALDGRDGFSFAQEDFAPGLYRVVCRVRDTAQPPGERDPWVVADPAGLLESERVWWIRIEQ